MLAQALGINLDKALVAEDPAKPSWTNAMHATGENRKGNSD